MAYPEIDLPMYEPLKAISAELFLPNINLIEPNSITLLETNQRSSRPTWSASTTSSRASCCGASTRPTSAAATSASSGTCAASSTATAETATRCSEKLHDIPPLHTWPRDSALGDHDNRERAGRRTSEELVLVIRGELLKKYPNAVIYAPARGSGR